MGLNYKNISDIMKHYFDPDYILSREDELRLDLHIGWKEGKYNPEDQSRYDTVRRQMHSEYSVCVNTDRLFA